MSVTIVSIIDNQGAQTCNGDELTVVAGTIIVCTDNSSNAMTGRIFDFNKLPIGVTAADTPPVGPPSGLVKWTNYTGHLGADQVVQIDDPDVLGACVEFTLNVITGPRPIGVSLFGAATREAGFTTAGAGPGGKKSRDLVINNPSDGETVGTTFTATGKARIDGKPTAAALIGIVRKKDGTADPVVAEFVSAANGTWSKQFTGLTAGDYDLFVLPRNSRAGSARVGFSVG